MSTAQSRKFSYNAPKNAKPTTTALDLDALYATQFTTASREQSRTTGYPTPINPAYTEFPAQGPSPDENRSTPAVQSSTFHSSHSSLEKYWRADSAHICIDQFVVEDSQSPAPVPHMPLQKADFVAGRISAANRPQASRFVAQEEAFDQVEESITTKEIAKVATEKPFPFVAAMEVEQFAWLPVVDNLCLQQPTSFDRILSELKQEQRLGHRVIAVTSIKPGEGRTTIVQCLARRAAMQGLRVCIVDVDHQYPQLAEQLGLQIDAGWEATLTTPLAINDLAIESLRDQICLVPMKQALPDELIVEHQTTCGKWLSELKRDFDLVLIDAAPTYEIIDRTTNTDAATAIHPLASWAIDSWLLVRNVQETSLAELARWNRRAQSLKLNILGVLENRTATEAMSTH